MTALSIRESISLFWGDDVEEPIITSGIIVYKDISKRHHWDLWNVWYGWSNNLKILICTVVLIVL